MSYVRFSDKGNPHGHGYDSSVYVLACDGGVECCGCILLEDPDKPHVCHSFVAPTAEGMAQHLRDHIAAGHDVPDHAIEHVLADAEFIEENRKKE